ncbi:MAG: hypothetical protein JWM45_3649, partial [Pseudonocardiales bacterium]|nr:hypothetical protein [Pseudonocardiales bacterium]
MWRRTPAQASGYSCHPRPSVRDSVHVHMDQLLRHHGDVDA